MVKSVVLRDIKVVAQKVEVAYQISVATVLETVLLAMTPYCDAHHRVELPSLTRSSAIRWC